MMKHMVSYGNFSPTEISIRKPHELNEAICKVFLELQKKKKNPNVPYKEHKLFSLIFERVLHTILSASLVN